MEPEPRNLAVTMVSEWTKNLFTFLNEEARAFLLARAGVSESELTHPQGRIGYDAAMRLCAAAVEISGDEDAGLHFAEHMDGSALGVIGYFAAAADTLDTALARVVAYHRLIKDPGQLAVERTQERVTVIEMPPAGVRPWPRPFAEALIAAYVTLGRKWTGENITARAVSFQHAAPGNTSEHRRVLGCEPTFGARDNRISFDSHVMRHPLKSGDAALGRYLRVAADQELAALPREEPLLRDLERAILAALPDGTPSIGRIARAMGLSARTLQRRLADRSRRFQDLVDGVRRGAAERLLDDDRLTIAEVAFLLGFSDASGLQRAHRRWTGRPPRGRAQDRHAAS